MVDRGHSARVQRNVDRLKERISKLRRRGYSERSNPVLILRRRINNITRRRDIKRGPATAPQKAVIVTDRKGKVISASRKILAKAPKIIGEKPSERQKQFLTTDITSQRAKNIIAEQRRASPRKVQTISASQQQYLKNKEKQRVSKQYTTIVNQKLQDNKRIKLEELFLAEFGTRQANLSQDLTQSKYNEIKNIVKFENAVFNEKKVGNLFTQGKRKIWQLVLKPKDYPIVVKISERLNFIEQGGKLTIKERSKLLKLTKTLFNIVFPTLFLTTPAARRVIKKKITQFKEEFVPSVAKGVTKVLSPAEKKKRKEKLEKARKAALKTTAKLAAVTFSKEARATRKEKLKKTIGTKEGLKSVGRTSISPVLGVVQSTKEFITFPQIVSELLILNTLLKKGPKNKTIKESILKRLNIIEKRALKFSRNNKKYKKDVANALIIESFLLGGQVLGAGAATSSKTIKAFASFGKRGFNLFGKTASATIIGAAVVNPTSENIGYVVQLTGLKYLPKVVKYVEKVPIKVPIKTKAIYYDAKIFLLPNRSGRLVKITDPKLVRTLNKLYSKGKGTSIKFDQEIISRQVSINNRIRKAAQQIRHLEKRATRLDVYGKRVPAKKGPLALELKNTIRRQGFKNYAEYKKAQKLYSRYEKGDLKASTELDLLEKMVAGRRIKQEFKLSKTKDPEEIKIKKEAKKIIEIIEKGWRTMRTPRGPLPEKFKIHLRKNGFKSYKEYKDYRVLFKKSLKGNKAAERKLSILDIRRRANIAKSSWKKQTKQRELEIKKEAAKEKRRVEKIKLASRKAKKIGQKRKGLKPKQVLAKLEKSKQDLKLEYNKQLKELDVEVKKLDKLKKLKRSPKQIRRQFRKVAVFKAENKLMQSKLKLEDQLIKERKILRTTQDILKQTSSSRARKQRRDNLILKLKEQIAQQKFKLDNERAKLKLEGKEPEVVTIKKKTTKKPKINPKDILFSVKSDKGRVVVTKQRKAYVFKNIQTKDTQGRVLLQEQLVEVRTVTKTQSRVLKTKSKQQIKKTLQQLQKTKTKEIKPQRLRSKFAKAPRQKQAVRQLQKTKTITKQYKKLIKPTTKQISLYKSAVALAVLTQKILALQTKTVSIAAKTKTITIQNVRQIPKIKSYQGLAFIVSAPTKSKLTSATRIINDTILKTTRQIKTPIKPKAKTPPKPTSRRPPIKPPAKKPPKTRIITLKPPKLSWRTKPPKGYSRIVTILVKQKGKVRRLRVKLPENRAYALGKRYVDNKTIRSFELQLVGFAKVKDIKKPSLKKFRDKISKDPSVLILVEKTKYAIDTPGEKRELRISRKRKKNL
jgi:hypothetical protein